MLEASLILCLLLPLLFIFFKIFLTNSDSKSQPKSYPFIGSYLSIYTNRHRLTQWTSDVIQTSPTFTFLLRRPFGQTRVLTVKILNEKKQDHTIQSVDLLSRFLDSGQLDENYVTDIVISFILAGRDTTSAALTWFFWLLSKNPTIESEVVKEIKEKSDSPVYDEVKDMVYTHAGLCESMRLYPPVPVDSKMANADDVLPDGTIVKKGMMVSYHPYAMGRMESIWGKDWMEFLPERWLVKDETTEKMKFTGKDPYTYPVFQAGPRICLGKDMAFLQMKRVVAGVLRQFKVVPVVGDGGDPVFVAALTSKMKGGFPVKIKERK